MDVLNPFPQVSYVLQKSLGLWLSIWAIRYNAGVDYKLSARGRTIRWAVVVICFALTSVPGANLGWFRVSSYFLGLAFLCRPNLAYHLGKSFEEWPTAEGRVDSVQQRSASRWKVGYDFEVSGECYGGHASVSSGAGIKVGPSSESARILIRYDPLNPGRSSRIQGPTATSNG
jgi:hypothetical protein